MNSSTQSLNDPCIKSPWSWFFRLPGYQNLGNNFQVQISRQIQNKIKNILGYESGAPMGLIDEKPEVKMLFYCHFKHMFLLT